MATVIIRPTGDIAHGGNIKFYPDNFAGFYNKVNEAVADDHTTFLHTNATTQNNYADFAMANLTAYEGSINKVSIAIRAMVGSGYNYYVKSRVNGIDNGSFISVSDTFTTYTQDWVINPSTGLAWTWTDINNMSVGIKAYEPNTKAIGEITQVYAIVDYSVGYANNINGVTVNKVNGITPNKINGI